MVPKLWEVVEGWWGLLPCSAPTPCFRCLVPRHLAVLLRGGGTRSPGCRFCGAGGAALGAWRPLVVPAAAVPWRLAEGPRQARGSQAPEAARPVSVWGPGASCPRSRRREVVQVVTGEVWVPHTARDPGQTPAPALPVEEQLGPPPALFPPPPPPAFAGVPSRGDTRAPGTQPGWGFLTVLLAF